MWHRSGGCSPGGHWGALTFLWSGGGGECWGPKRGLNSGLCTDGAWFLDKLAATREKRSVAVLRYEDCPLNNSVIYIYICIVV